MKDDAYTDRSAILWGQYEFRQLGYEIHLRESRSKDQGQDIVLQSEHLRLVVYVPGLELECVGGRGTNYNFDRGYLAYLRRALDRMKATTTDRIGTTFNAYVEGKPSAGWRM